ncbi:hypothetical protein DNTS_023145 [Danionella cerebrum]|uniref:Small lysine-rich protein 1 n=1 Tax=Danionella cerebrum TaxID=2873325 RepID=A0A553NJ10_9TELE|nr:hypothetical protein DNTS_023145 [Danionella translucida]
MPSGRKKARSQSARPATKSKRKPTSRKKRSVSAKTSKPELDLLSPEARKNLYYICHNVMDCLELTGFRWTGASNKKTGKKGKKQKGRK